MVTEGEMRKRLRTLILSAASDSALGFIYDERKEDEDLPRGKIEEAIKDGIITVEDIVARFKFKLRSSSAVAANIPKAVWQIDSQVRSGLYAFVLIDSDTRVVLAYFGESTNAFARSDDYRVEIQPVVGTNRLSGTMSWLSFHSALSLLRPTYDFSGLELPPKPEGWKSQKPTREDWR